MLPLYDAPKDGRRITLIRQRGDKHIGRWDIKQDAMFRNPTEPTWLTDDNKFLDIPLNPVIGWEP